MIFCLYIWVTEETLSERWRPLAPLVAAETGPLVAAAAVAASLLGMSRRSRWARHALQPPAAWAA